MELRHVHLLLVCCSALWVAVSSFSRVKTPLAPAPGCDAMLAFSSEIPSLPEGNGNIHHRSLSPWSWRSHTVKNRIPSTLWEAKCSSSYCSSPVPGPTDPQDLNSVPVYQDILVLTRQDGGTCFTAAYVSLAVGCTCVKAQTSQG